MRFCIYGFSALLFLAPVLALADAPAPTTDTSAQLQTPYKTEQEWIISSICRNAYELLAYARDKKGEAVTPAQVTLKLIPGDPLSYDVTLKGVSVTVEAKLQWPDSIWSPAAYLPFCQAAAQALKLAPATAPTAQGNPLHDLLDFSETAIEGENHRVSQWLTAQPDNSAAHEQAALILGTLAMKENSGFFWDARDMCNHICAHLAVAQFFRGGTPTSIEGRLANICIGLIVDTKTQTGKDLDALAAEKTPPADLAAWLNACRMRNTRDWRIVKTPETASAFEQVEFFRAYSEAVDSDLAIKWLRDHNAKNRIDWERITLEMPYSVEGGHVFAEKSIGQEVYIMHTTFPGSFDKTSLIGDLNEPPGDAVNFKGTTTGTPEVISRGMWAAFFQRHLCQAIAETGNFLANKWGVPDYAQKLDQAVQKSFPGLTLYPFLQLVEFHLRKMPAASVDTLVLFNAHPEWAPDFLVWMQPPADSDAPRVQQAVTAWFTPAVTHGTALGAMSREPKDGWPPAQMDQLYAIAPLQIIVAQSEVKRLYGDHFTSAQYEKTMGPLLDYYTSVIDQAKDATDLTFDQRVTLAEKSAAIDPDNYYQLAHLYQENQKDDKAAEAYQKWFDGSSDRVSVSNSMEWLVNYYYDHGQTDKAMAIAKDTAEVYSEVGLETMMRLQERMGQLDQAEDYAQKINERYSDSGPLARLYKVNVDKGTAGYQAKFDQLAATVFPQGMKKVTLSNFSGPPTSGMQFGETSGAMQAAGLSSDQVIVALDGYAVGGTAQFTFVRALTDSPAMDFIVWDGQAYREIKANRPGRRFGVSTQDYHP
jgi:tetratricopeptide (TPR) repeat protein